MSQTGLADEVDEGMGSSGLNLGMMEKRQSNLSMESFYREEL